MTRLPHRRRPALLLALGLSLLATGVQADYLQHPKAAEFVSRLAAQGVPETDSRALLASARRNPKLIQAEQQAPEKTRPWDEYLAIFLQESRISNGLKFWAEHQATLARAEHEYGVPPEYLVAIIGVETLYGGYTGPHRVLDSLATQGLEHPTRQHFFFNEFVEFVLACREHGLDPYTVQGSYAGAMGWAQFMPSNYRRLALDFDNNGRTDLWTAADAIGSAANYLQHYRGPEHRWLRDTPIVVAALGEPPGDWPRNQKRGSHRYRELSRQLTAVPAIDPDMEVGLIELVGSQHTERWLALPNFYALMSYNPRPYYAMAVYRLGRAIRDRRP